MGWCRGEQGHDGQPDHRQTQRHSFLGGGEGSSTAIGPSSKKVASGGLNMVTPVRHEEEIDMGEDLFVWPHPTNSGKALFMVDGTAERAMREAVS